MSLFCRQACGRLAFLAILAGIVLSLVACEAGPGTSAQPDPVKIKAVTFEKVGTAREIPLGDKFSGEELTYTATSSNKAVATVAIDKDDDILTVTAIGAGKATITVTAADSQDRTASQTFKVTVKATTSEPEPGAPTVRTGAPGSFDVDQGDTQTVTLSRVFTGEDLEFTVASNDPNVATASEDAGILTITARSSPGDATITVTATNDDGNATHRITVTVPSPVTATPTTNNPSLDCPSPLTIDRNTSKKCTFPSNATLREPAGEEVEVTKIPGDGPDVWTITARKRGTYKITIESGGATKTKLGEITVIVPNSQPLYTHPAPDALGKLNLKCSPTGTTSTTSPYTCTIIGGIGQFFTDPDDPDAQLKYSLGAPLDSILIDAEEDGGWVAVTDAVTDADNVLMLEVLKEVTKNFSVSIYSHDDTEKSDLPVVLTVTVLPSTSLKPKEVEYSVDQGSNGDLNDEGDLDVGPRIVVGAASHSLTFQSYVPPGADSVASPFQFVKKLNETAGIKDSKKLPDSRVAPPTLYHKGDMPDSKHKDWEPGFSFLVLESSNPVEEAKWTDTAGDVVVNSVVNFKLKEGSRRGWIKITYYVVYAKDNYPQDDEDGAVANDNATRIGSEQLYVNIVACNSPPDPLTECP